MKAHLSARLPAIGRKDFFSDPEAMLVCEPGDLGPVPPSRLHLVSGPNTQGDLLPDSRGAAHAYCQRPDQSVTIRPPSSARPTLDASTMAAELESESAEGSNLKTHHFREGHHFRMAACERESAQWPRCHLVVH